MKSCRVADRSAGWLWALVLVACLHLLGTPGTWLVSDHAEEIFMARRLVAAGTLTLAPAGEPLPELPWWEVWPDRPSRSRLLPGTAFALVPFVVLDRVLGWDSAAELGTLTHVAGHAYVLAALGLLGGGLVASGASAGAAAATVVLCGTAWPVWQVSRHGGAEPVLAFLVALFLYGRLRGRLAPRVVACAALPWVHPSGSLIAPVLAMCECDELPWRPEGRAEALARLRRLLPTALVSVAGVVLVWNQLYHGSWWGGGYATQGAGSGFLARSALGTMADYVEQSLLFVPLIVVFALLGAWVGGREGVRGLVIPVALLLTHLVLYGLFSTPSGQEPARRLSVVWVAWGVSVGAGWDGLRLDARVQRGLLALSVLLGLYWFWLREFDYYPAGNGLYYPLVLWVTLARQGAPIWQALGPPVALVLLAGFAATRLRSAFDRAPAADPGRTP